MTSMEFLELLSSVGDRYVAEAREEPPVRRTLPRRPLLIAAIVVLTLALAGCTYAYAQGWFTAFFASRSEEPLSSEQIEFIREHEQILVEPQTKSEWTVELKSAITDGKTAYVIFGVTAPENVDLEKTNLTISPNRDAIIPGNRPSMVYDPDSRTMFATSIGIASGLGNASPEKNILWSGGSRWEADNDGLSNTLNYVFEITADRMDPRKEMLLEDPFASDITFHFVFQNFIHTWEDAQRRAEIDAKYAGQDYMIDNDEMEGLHRSELLVEETWEFTVTFDTPAQESIQLITGEPVMTWGLVTWKLDDDPTFYDTGSGIAAVKIVSFVLSPFGATLEYEFEEPAFSAFIEYRQRNGYTDRHVYAVMRDGSKVALHTNGTGDKLTAETPIVLSEVDHILLGDGATIPVP